MVGKQRIKYRATVMFTSPTAIRVLSRQDPALLRRYDTSCLQRLSLAGEPLGGIAERDRSTLNPAQRLISIGVERLGTAINQETTPSTERIR